MAKLITDQKSIATAETSDLIHTYNKLEGKDIKKFESRQVAERKVAMAILAAENRAGQAGVKVGEKPTAKPMAPKAESKAAKPAPKAAKPAPKAAKPAPKAESKAAKPAAEAKVTKPKADKLISPTAEGKGETGIRAESFRGQILASIIAKPGISKAELVAKHGFYTADVVCKFKRLGLVTEA